MLYLNSIQYSAFCFAAEGKIAVQALYTGSLLPLGPLNITLPVFTTVCPIDRGCVFCITTTIMFVYIMLRGK